MARVAWPAAAVAVVLLISVLAFRDRVYLPTQFVQAVAAADRVTLFEGLPHPTYEPEFFANERAKPVREFAGFPFYPEPLDWRDRDPSRLNSLLTAPGTLEPKNGKEKACGGFHPDYAVEWEPGPDRWRALICLHCKEVWLFGPGADSPEGYFVNHHRFLAKLQPLLEGYHRSRPAPARRERGGRE